MIKLKTGCRYVLKNGEVTGELTEGCDGWMGWRRKGHAPMSYYMYGGRALHGSSISHEYKEGESDEQQGC